MIFSYKATSANGDESEGTIDATNKDFAVATLQKKGLIVLSIKKARKGGIFQISLFERVSAKDIVILSRQLSTLFEAQVTVIESFKLMSEQSENPMLKQVLSEVVDDIQGGKTVNASMQKHPKVFSEFYFNMIKIGEETGRLSETFSYLADYLERQYALVSKTKHALIYPAFIVAAFFGVMILMFTFVIPQLTVILEETGQELPFYTKIVIGTSKFFVNYGIFLLMGFVIAGLSLWRVGLTSKGKLTLARLKLSAPGFGNLYTKFYLSRIADNLDATISSGIPMIRAIEITGDVVGDPVYKKIMYDAREVVRGGGSLSKALFKYEEIPPIMVQMIRVGEETGKLGFVLGTVARFYKGEVEAAIDTLIDLIEPVMIIFLGLGVGILLTSVLMPIYNVAGSIA